MEAMLIIIENRLANRSTRPARIRSSSTRFVDLVAD